MSEHDDNLHRSYQNPIFCTRHLTDLPGADFISYVQQKSC